MIGLARLAGPVACLGLALLLVARTRRDRLAGLGFAALGACMLAAALAPAKWGEAVLGGLGALVVGAVLAVAFRRYPWLLPLLALACIPARVGALGHQLLVPLYVVVVGAALALAWELAHGDIRPRELRRAAWPLAAYVAWVGLSLGWTQDTHEGATEVLAFYVPFTVLAVCIARLPWSRRWLWAFYGELTAMALVFSGIGFYQYESRNVFENPKVINSNAYASFFRVNSVFWDPSVYGRFLVVAMVPSIVLIAASRSLRLAWGAAVVLVITWLGLLISFSQSSFAALVVAVIGVSVVAWRWKSLIAVGLAVAVLAGVAVAQPAVRRSIQHHTTSGLNSASSGRYSLVANGIRIAVAHPVRGVGVGGFRHAYARRVTRLHGKKNLKHGGVPRHARDGGGGDRRRRCGAVRLAPRRARPRRLRRPAADRRAVGGARPRRHPRALALLQRLLRGSDDVAPARLRRARGAAGGARGGACVIESWKRALVLAPHTDDGEFGCGGTMARLVEAGCDVRYVAFSIATRSLPDGFPPDTLAREVREATTELGIPPERLDVHDFDVRTFPERRQEILEQLVALWEEWKPDVVFQPSLHDIHQDHQTVAQEGLRAFKRTTILGYEIPWNNFDFAYQWYVALEKKHIERKVAALEKYASQQHRRYANPEYVWNVARTHGINVNREYAEVFQVYRVID